MSAPMVFESAWIREEHLESLMQRRLGQHVRGLRIVILAAGVVLSGRTSKYHVRQLAEDAAQELGNLPILANEIEVC